VAVIVGPTAAGKSALAAAVAERLDGEVVSADAFQVYRGLDIGTAKVSREVTTRVPHHCIDIADPDEHFSAGRYAREAAAAIADIQSRGRLAIVAGGSGFYIRALVEGLAPLPRRDARWRAALEAVAERRGLGFIHAMLERLDPGWADAVGPADRQRLLRGLEVTLRCGRPMSALLAERGRSGPRYEAIWVGLSAPRPLLYERIATRVDDMLAAGWREEVRGLLERGYTARSPGLRAIGYRELVAHLQGELALPAAREQIVRATRRYAKRQLTWFRGQTAAIWFEVASGGESERRRLHEAVSQQLRSRLTC
jgi:tRNA dimethylallyltransferase